MSLLAPTVICERVRGQVSLELDGELSQLERRMVSAHLSRCAECRTFAEGAASFTRALREAPLELFERPIAVRQLRRPAVLGRFQVGVAAAVAMVAVGLASQLGSGGSSRAGSPDAVSQFQTRAELERELALIELTQSHGPSSAEPVL